MDVQNYALTRKVALITTAAMSFSENSQDNYFLGCWSTNDRK